MLRRTRASSLIGSLTVCLALVAPAACTGKRKTRAAPSGQKDTAGPAAPAPAVDADEPPPTTAAASPTERFRVPVGRTDAARGAAQPLVTIVAFSDFECPFCARLAQTLDTLMPKYEADVRLVFKHYPLPNHANAEPAARAAAAAGRQDKFWPMHDRLFADQSKLGPQDLQATAAAIGLDMTQFNADLQDPALQAAVAEQFADGRVLTVSTTPTFFINGRMLTGAKPAEEIAVVLDEELAAAKAMVAAGTPREAVYATLMRQATPGSGTRPDRDPTHRRGEASKRTNYSMSVAEHSPVRGPADALVTIVEYGAFPCAACAALEPTLDQLLAKYPKDVRLAWRQFTDGSPDAMAAARASVAAHKQGKFWPLHDKMLANHTNLNAGTVTAWAKEVGIDETQFGADLRDDSVARQIAIDEAVANKVRGTAPAPFLWVNGRIVDSRDAPTLADIEALVLEEKAKAEAFMAEHDVPRARLYEAMRATFRGHKLIEQAGESAP